MSIRGITMTGKGFEGMRESELCALEAARVQVGKVASLRAKCDEIAPNGGYRSPNLTGMPGGSREPCGLDGSRRDCEALLEELAREERTLETMIRGCEKIIARSGMKAEMKEFCRNYYLRRMSVESASDFAGISRRTGWNYRAEIFAKRKRKNKAAQRKNSL
ncbi:MAG: hypothetical protein J6M56_00165 [Clostridia bacterium]|nr:hypothetical protein [Clostridia bacterium]